MEEKQKNPWYKSTPGLVLIVLFWYVLVPVVIYQSKMEKKKKIMYGSIYIFAMILFYGSIFLSENKSSVSKREETKNNEIAKSEELQKLSQEKAKLEEEKRNLEIRKNVETEKNRIINEIVRTWDKADKVLAEYLESTKTNVDPYDFYYKGKESLTITQETLSEFQNLNCNITGDENFDNKCKKTSTRGRKVLKTRIVYFQEATDAMYKILTDSPPDKEEINQISSSANDTLDEAVKLFQNFKFEIHDLKNY